MNGRFNLNGDHIDFTRRSDVLWIFDTPKGAFAAEVVAKKGWIKEAQDDSSAQVVEEPDPEDDIDSTMASGERIWYRAVQDIEGQFRPIPRGSHLRGYVLSLLSASIHWEKHHAPTESTN